MFFTSRLLVELTQDRKRRRDSNRKIEKTVAWSYRLARAIFLTPFLAAGMAMVPYFVVCAGFFSANTMTQNMNAYGFAGLAGFVGLFSTMTVNKLRRMAIELLSPLEKEEDPVREESDAGK